MNLWIRNQNREQLIPIYSRLYICNWDIGENSYSVSTDIIEHRINNLVLGYYNSKERALEVLDEIQNAILGIIADEDVEEQGRKEYTGNAFLSKCSNNIVYEMPKE